MCGIDQLTFPSLLKVPVYTLIVRVAPEAHKVDTMPIGMHSVLGIKYVFLIIVCMVISLTIGIIGG